MKCKVCICRSGLALGLLLPFLASCSASRTVCEGFPTTYITVRQHAPAIMKGAGVFDLKTLSKNIDQCRPDDLYVKRSFHLIYQGHYEKNADQYALYSVEESSDIAVSYKVDPKMNITGAYIFDGM